MQRVEEQIAEESLNGTAALLRFQRAAVIARIMDAPPPDITAITPNALTADFLKLYDHATQNLFDTLAIVDSEGRPVEHFDIGDRLPRLIQDLQQDALHDPASALFDFYHAMVGASAFPENSAIPEKILQPLIGEFLIRLVQHPKLAEILDATPETEETLATLKRLDFSYTPGGQITRETFEMALQGPPEPTPDIDPYPVQPSATMQIDGHDIIVLRRGEERYLVGLNGELYQMTEAIAQYERYVSGTLTPEDQQDLQNGKNPIVQLERSMLESALEVANYQPDGKAPVKDLPRFKVRLQLNQDELKQYKADITLDQSLDDLPEDLRDSLKPKIQALRNRNYFGGEVPIVGLDDGSVEIKLVSTSLERLTLADLNTAKALNSAVGKAGVDGISGFSDFIPPSWVVGADEDTPISNETDVAHYLNYDDVQELVEQHWDALERGDTFDDPRYTPYQRLILGINARITQVAHALQAQGTEEANEHYKQLHLARTRLGIMLCQVLGAARQVRDQNMGRQEDLLQQGTDSRQGLAAPEWVEPPTMKPMENTQRLTIATRGQPAAGKNIAAAVAHNLIGSNRYVIPSVDNGRHASITQDLISACGDHNKDYPQNGLIGNCVRDLLRRIAMEKNYPWLDDSSSLSFPKYEPLHMGWLNNGRILYLIDVTTPSLLINEKGEYSGSNVRLDQRGHDTGRYVPWLDTFGRDAEAGLAPLQMRSDPQFLTKLCDAGGCYFDADNSGPVENRYIISVITTPNSGHTVTAMQEMIDGCPESLPSEPPIIVHYPNGCIETITNLTRLAAKIEEVQKDTSTLDRAKIYHKKPSFAIGDRARPTDHLGRMTEEQHCTLHGIPRIGFCTWPSQLPALQETSSVPGCCGKEHMTVEYKNGHSCRNPG